MLPTAESGASADRPAGVSEGRCIVMWSWLVWSEFWAMEPGDLDPSLFPNSDLSILIHETGIMPIPLGVSSIQSNAIMKVKMLCERREGPFVLSLLFAAVTALISQGPLES